MGTEEAQAHFSKHRGTAGPHFEIYTDIQDERERGGTIGYQPFPGDLPPPAQRTKLTNNVLLIGECENTLVYHIINLLWVLGDKGISVCFCRLWSHSDSESSKIEDQLARQTIDHDIHPLANVHNATLKPLVNFYIQQVIQISGKMYLYRVETWTS